MELEVNEIPLLNLGIFRDGLLGKGDLPIASGPFIVIDRGFEYLGSRAYVNVLTHYVYWRNANRDGYLTIFPLTPGGAGIKAYGDRIRIDTPAGVIVLRPITDADNRQFRGTPSASRLSPSTIKTFARQTLLSLK